MFLLLLILLIGCVDKDKDFTTSDLKKITIELDNQESLDDGTSYSLKLVNKSDYTIKQNNVFMSYPLKQNNGYTGNEYKVEAEGNKLDIKPGEEIELKVFAPFKGVGDKDSLSFDTPNILVEGYLETVNEKSKFSFNKSIKSK